MPLARICAGGGPIPRAKGRPYRDPARYLSALCMDENPRKSDGQLDVLGFRSAFLEGVGRRLWAWMMSLAHSLAEPNRVA